MVMMLSGKAQGIGKLHQPPPPLYRHVHLVPPLLLLMGIGVVGVVKGSRWRGGLVGMLGEPSVLAKCWCGPVGEGGSRGSGHGCQGYLLLLPWELGVGGGGAAAGYVPYMLVLLVGVAETNSSGAAVRSSLLFLLWMQGLLTAAAAVAASWARQA